MNERRRFKIAGRSVFDNAMRPMYVGDEINVIEVFPGDKIVNDDDPQPEDKAAPRLPHHHDSVNHPKHYTAHPSGVECITITEHMGFCLGNAIKYIWRADEKGNAIEDLEKAKWYVEREIARRNTAS